jgi:hypothetical protein
MSLVFDFADSLEKVVIPASEENKASVKVLKQRRPFSESSGLGSGWNFAPKKNGHP